MQHRAPLVLLTAVAGLFAWGELEHWRASWRRLGGGAELPAAAEAVVVLGFRNRGTRANYVNRYRVRAGLRSQNPQARESVLVLCGGAVGGDISEAELMARYARDRCGYTGPILLDAESTSTRENIRNAIPLIEDADTIKVVSDSLHAEIGRAILERLRPDLARRLRRAQEYRFGEIAVLKPLAALVGLRYLARHHL